MSNHNLRPTQNITASIQIKASSSSKSQNQSAKKTHISAKMSTLCTKAWNTARPSITSIGKAQISAANITSTWTCAKKYPWDQSTTTEPNLKSRPKIPLQNSSTPDSIPICLSKCPCSSRPITPPWPTVKSIMPMEIIATNFKLPSEKKKIGSNFLKNNFKRKKKIPYLWRDYKRNIETCHQNMVTRWKKCWISSWKK